MTSFSSKCTDTIGNVSWICLFFNHIFSCCSFLVLSEGIGFSKRINYPIYHFRSTKIQTSILEVKMLIGMKFVMMIQCFMWLLTWLTSMIMLLYLINLNMLEVSKSMLLCKYGRKIVEVKFYSNLNWQNSSLRSLSLTFNIKKKDLKTN